jgi:hypothetical protein
MNHFDDCQIEESAGFDFTEADLDGLFDEDEDTQTFNSFLNSNIDY